MNKKSKAIWVLYPFTPSTLGTQDSYVIQSNNSNALFVALRRIQKKSPRIVKSVYITDSRTGYKIDEKNIIYQFSPITFSTSKKHNGFGSQWSFDMAWNLAKERPGLVLLFIGGGWFAIFLSIVCYFLSIPYCPIIAGWGTSTRRSQKWYYKNALHVIVHTNSHKLLFQQAGVDISNFLVMPMGVNTDLFVSKPEVNYMIQNRPLRFIHLGRIARGKNLLGALKIFLRLLNNYPESMFDVIGPVYDSEYYASVQKYIEENKLANKVILHGNIPNQQLPEYYANADFMIFPTLSESFGFVIAESMACGTPVAALHGRGSPDEIIKDGVDGILAQDEAEMVEKILEILQNPERLIAMGKSARQKVELLYSANRTYEQLLELTKEAELLQR